MRKILLPFLVFVGLAVEAWLMTAHAATSFGVEIGRFNKLNQTASSDVITLTVAVPAGTWIGLLESIESSSQTLSSVADTRGNTWATPLTRLISSVHYGAVSYSYVATALQIGDTITLTYNSSANTSRGVIVGTINGATSSSQPDVTFISPSSGTFGSTINSSITTTVDGDAIMGLVIIQGDHTYTIGNGTQIGAQEIVGFVPASTVGLRLIAFYNIQSTHGAFSPAGSVVADDAHICIMFSLKPAGRSFHVSTSGSDASNGLSAAAAWRHAPGDTNATSTAAGTTLAADDSVFFKGGDTFSFDVAIKQSGTSGHLITYDGTGRDGTGAAWGSGWAIVDLANTYYHAFDVISPSTKNYFKVKGFKITRAKNSNSRQNQTINRGGSDITGVNYGGDGDIYSEGTLQFNHAGNFVLEDLIIYESENCYDRAVLNAEGDGNSLTDLNCPVEKSAISILGTANNVTISNLVAWATGHHIIKFAGVATALITDSNLGGTAAAGAVSTNVGWFAVGVKMSSGGSGQPLSNVTVRRTLVHDGWQYQGDESQQRSHSGDWFHLYGDGDGILEAADDTFNILFDRVYCYNDHQFLFNNGTANYFLESDVYNVEWRNCISVNDFSGDIEMRDCSNIVINAHTSISAGNQPLLYKSGSASGFAPKAIKVRNSVFITQSANSANVPMGTSSSYTGDMVDSDYNLFYHPAHANMVSWNNTSYTMTSWRNATGNDTHSIDGSPGMISLPTGSSWATASSGNYHPNSATPSALIGAGSDLSSTFTIDYDGITRTLPWTIGALLGQGGGGPNTLKWQVQGRVYFQGTATLP